MNLKTGIKRPLHRRFDEKKALEFIRNRYRHCRSKIAKQIEVLQQDKVFQEKCKEYYKKGYKDWVIVSAVLNCMINLKAREIGLSLSSKKDLERLLKLSNMLRNTVYPTIMILEDLDSQVKLHSVYALNTYAFKLRRKDFNPDVVENFLRERMRHFDFDLPHAPLFGKPLGSWPVV